LPLESTASRLRGAFPHGRAETSPAFAGALTIVFRAPRSRQPGGVACVLRPTLAGHCPSAQARSRQRRVATPASWRPRMGPAPASATAGLRHVGSRLQENSARPRDVGSDLQDTTARRGAGGLGMRAQAPFAVARDSARCWGVDETMLARGDARPRAWAGERVPGPPAPAPAVGTRAPRSKAARKPGPPAPARAAGTRAPRSEATRVPAPPAAAQGVSTRAQRSQGARNNPGGKR
jgi:hypothetical protein